MGLKRAARQQRDIGKPAFDEEALVELTGKIDKTLPAVEQKIAGKRKRQNASDDGRGSKRRQTHPTEAEEHRDSHAAAKDKANRILLEEIIALGGDEKDLELVADVDSGNEGGGGPSQPKISSEQSLDQSFKDELAKFAASLGFHQFHNREDLNTEDEASPDEDAVGSTTDVSSDSDEGGGQEEMEKEDVDSFSDNEEKVTEKVDSGEAKIIPQDTKKGKQFRNLIIDPRPDWHAFPLDELPASRPDHPGKYSASIANLKSYAESLLEEDTANYQSAQAHSSTRKFMSTIMSSGTLSDKISALTLSIQESPLHNRKAFESLITLAGKKNRGQAIAALGALVDLLGNGAVLPDDRRLRPFGGQPALFGALQGSASQTWVAGQTLPGKLTKAHLVMWAYEDWLKAAYFRIIQLLEVWCSDEIEYSRSRALDFVFGLLKNKPEQEANLLRLLVNKLGDRERKIASRASYLLLQLLNVHPGMKGIVIGTVEQEVLLKPGQSLRTKYTAINTLNQTILSTREPSIADKLLRIYFDMFLALLKSGVLGNVGALNGDKRDGGTPRKKSNPSGSLTVGNEQDVAQKLVSALLTGVNRAIPFATTEDSTLEKHLDTLFRITHSSNFNTSIQALMLIQQLATSKQLAVDRFYRTLYESLLDPRLVTSSKHALYLNLIFRAMKNDADVRRVKAFVKRLIQILTLHQPSFTCGVLFLISELQKTFPDLRTLLDDPEEADDDGEEVYKDVCEDGTLDNVETQGVTSSFVSPATAYDGRKRDPEHSNAHRSCLWELTPLLSHYHPSVGIFARNLLSPQQSLPKPDLAHHTLMHFLDKFVYRNPKAEETKRGGSIMQPVLASGGTSRIVVSSKAAAKQQQSVNSASFWNLKPEQVLAEDVFFHEYFTRIGKPGKMTRKRDETKREFGSGDETGDEDEIWDALVKSKPDVEGPNVDDDSDADLGDFDYSDDEEDGSRTDGSMSDIGMDSDGFEGIFDDAGESDEQSSGEDEAPTKAKKGTATSGQKGRLSKKELKTLPTFASAEDYADILAAEDDGLDD